MIKYMMKNYALSKQGAKDCIKAVIANILTNLLSMLPVAMLYMLISDLVSSLNGNTIEIKYWLYAVLIAAYLLVILLANFVQYNWEYLNTYKESEVRRLSLAEKLRKLPISFFGKKDLSDLTTTIMGDCAILETAFSHWYPKFFGSIISTTIVSIGLFIFDWRMALAALWVLPVSLAIVIFTRKIQSHFLKKNNNAVLECSDGIQECLDSLRDLKSNNYEKEYLEGLNKKIDKIERTQRFAEIISAVFVVSAQLLLKFGIATTALAGGAFLINKTLDVMTFFAFLMLVARLYDPLGGSLENLSAMNVSRLRIDRMKEINEYKTQEGKSSFEPEGYDIEFKNVAFAYETSDTVLRDVSFTAKQGKVTALIGPSGGGKSTIARLAARFWDVDSGKITVGGEDVCKIDPETLLSAYSIVFQDVTLFNNTVMENIRIGKKNASDAEVMGAAKEARCMEFIEKLPQGFDTLIGENGSKLSGGERQRISIARALLKDAPIVLLDEATASLDAENETKIQEALSRLIKDKTVLIIAHRMRTVEGADKLICLKDGLLIEEGSPDELKKKDGYFSKSLELQKRKIKQIL